MLLKLIYQMVGLEMEWWSANRAERERWGEGVASVKNNVTTLHICF